MKVGKGIPLTPEKWMAQWMNLPHVLDVNLWDFEVSVGKAAVEIFRQSFDMRRFNSRGSMTWVQRPKTNKGGYTVGGLVESHSLKNSITYEADPFNGSNGRVRIFTDPAAFKNTYSHKGFCFAAVHNSDDPSMRTGRVAKMPQRQFMPTEKNDSTVMHSKLRELEKIIFRTFPGVRR